MWCWQRYSLPSPLGCLPPQVLYMVLCHRGVLELVSYGRTATLLMFCLHHTGCQDQCVWWSHGTQLRHSYVGCRSAQFMVSDPGSRSLGLRGGGTLERGEEAASPLQTSKMEFSEERQQNEQAGRKKRPGASRPGVTEPSQTVSQAPSFVPPLGHIFFSSLLSLCPLSGLAKALLQWFWRSSDAPLWMMGLLHKVRA